MLDTERKYDLKEHLYQKRMTITRFAEKLGSNRSYLSNIVNGKSKPGKRLAKDIERETEGLILAEELLK